MIAQRNRLRPQVTESATRPLLDHIVATLNVSSIKLLKECIILKFVINGAKGSIRPFVVLVLLPILNSIFVIVGLHGGKIRRASL